MHEVSRRLSMPTYKPSTLQRRSCAVLALSAAAPDGRVRGFRNFWKFFWALNERSPITGLGVDLGMPVGGLFQCGTGLEWQLGRGTGVKQRSSAIYVIDYSLTAPR